MGTKLQAYQEFKNVLSQQEIDDIYNTLIDNMFPWYYSGGSGMTVLYQTHIDDRDENTKEYFQFVHQFYSSTGEAKSDYAPMVDYILEKFTNYLGTPLKDKYRIKANFQPKSNFLSTQYNTPHFDRPYPHWVLIYYPHDTDGNTLIFSRKAGEEKNKYIAIASIKPEAGKFLLFDGSQYHTGSHPIDHDKRLIINFNIDLDE